MTSLSHTSKSQLVADFFAQHQAELVTFVCARLGSREESEDLVQDVAVKMLTLDAPICAATVKAFAYTIAANKVKDTLRRRIFRRRMEENALYTADRVHNPVERVVEYHDALRIVGQALQTLSPSCARVYHLSFEEGVPSGEIARRLGVSKRTVESQLLASRKKVRAYVRQAM